MVETPTTGIKKIKAFWGLDPDHEGARAGG